MFPSKFTLASYYFQDLDSLQKTPPLFFKGSGVFSI